MTLREEKPLQTPAPVSHKVPRTQWGGGKQTRGCRCPPTLFHLPLLLSFASSALGYWGDFAFLVGSYPVRPSLLKSSVKQLGGVSVKLLSFFLLCTEFSFPGPDDSSWGKYEETLAESHEGSEEEESMDVPSTCELEAQSFAERCTEGEIEAGSGSWHLLGIAQGEILPSLWSLPGLPQGSAWELDGSRGRWIARVQKKLRYTSSRL